VLSNRVGVQPSRRCPGRLGSPLLLPCQALASLDFLFEPVSQMLLIHMRVCTGKRLVPDSQAAACLQSSDVYLQVQQLVFDK